MSPSHSRKGATRHRYYVSSALIQGRPQAAGSVARIPAVKIEAAIVGAVRAYIGPDAPRDDAELITGMVHRIEMRRTEIAVTRLSEDHASDGDTTPSVVTVPWSKTPHRRCRDVIVPEGSPRAEAGQEGYGKRAEAFRQRYLREVTDPVPFYLVAARISLVKDHLELIRAVRSKSVRPIAVVLDTLNRSIDGSESDDKDMAAYIKAGDAIREEFDCAIIIVHHCGIDGTRPRGHTSLTGAVFVR